MNPNKALWEKGDFTRIAASMRESGDALVAALDITPGCKVLDLGCGDGTTALPAARRGADVLGVDIAANLVAAGNARARAEGLTNCRFEEGDASDLNQLADDTFDLVVSIFGAMFAPRPFDVAREMTRVTRPGGRIVMGNWIPQATHPTASVAQLLLKTSAAYSPPPPEGFISPVSWGVEGNVCASGSLAPRDRPGQHRLLAGDLQLRLPGKAARTTLLAAFQAGTTARPWNAFEAAEADGLRRSPAGRARGAVQPVTTRARTARPRSPPPTCASRSRSDRVGIRLQAPRQSVQPGGS